MNCPVCKEITLENKEIENNLIVKECSQCHGRWLPSFMYWKWVQVRDPKWIQQEKINSNKIKTNTDTLSAKICPECSAILTKAKVGHGVEFHIDKCNRCSGIWLDEGEWEALKSKDLHDRIYFIFSSTWQHSLSEEQKKEKTLEFYKKNLGDADFDKLEEFGKWIREHKHADLLLAYLMDQ